MHGRSRVSTTTDFGRLSASVERPGIDPREWVSLAIVTAVHVDPKHGPMADVILLPSEAPGTARYGAPYAGGGFGAYFPLRVDDEVLVAAPSGNPTHGLVVEQCLWSAADAPPAAAVDHPDDVLVQARDGQSVRVVTTGAGEVFLGDVNADQAAMRGTLYRDKQAALHTALQNATTTFAAAVAAWGAAFATWIGIAQPHAAPVDTTFAGATSTFIAAWAAYNAAVLSAVTEFESFTSEYLSPNVRVK